MRGGKSWRVGSRSARVCSSATLSLGAAGRSDSDQLPERVSDGSRENAHALRGVVVAAPDAHVLGLIIAEGAVAVVLPTVGMYQRVEVQHSHVVVRHHLLRPPVQQAHGVGRRSAAWSARVWAQVLRRFVGHSATQGTSLAHRWTATPIASVQGLWVLRR